MKPIERVEAVLKGEIPDRIPVMGQCWTYGAKMAGVSVKEFASNPKAMAQGNKVLYEQTGIDIVNPCCDVGATAEAWGVKLRFLPEITPQLEIYVVDTAEGWEKIQVVDPKKDGRMPTIIEANRIFHRDLSDVPAAPYTPSPLTCATHIRDMSDVLIDVVLNPELLHKGLRILSESMKEYNKALVEANEWGILYADTRASAEILTLEQYKEFGTPYDNIALSGLEGTSGKVIHHCCGLEPFFDELISMNFCDVINWWDRGATTNLRTAMDKYGGKVCLACGMDQTKTILMGSSSDVENEAKDALEAAKYPFILAPGCEVQSLRVPVENLRAMVTAAEIAKSQMK